ncbi:MAG TPA: hypothetical protein VIZ43_10145 [Trebonia sp.]
MSLDPRQERRLRRMARDLTESAPSLASKLNLFTELASSEDMPAGHEALAGRRRLRWPRPGRWLLPGRRGREKWTGREGWVVMMVALFIVGAVMAVPFGSSHEAGRSTQVARCARMPASACTSRFSVGR